MKYLIQPKNEDQDLNYSEIKDFKNENEASLYALGMCKALGDALPQGSISVEYERA